MQALVSHAKRDWGWLSLCSAVIADLPPKDHLREAKRMFDFVKERVRFAKDPRGVETLQHPRLTLQRGAGDCDDISTLLAALQETIGLKTRFITIKASPANPSEYSHVFCSVDIPGSGSYTEDASIQDAEFGWEAPVNFGRQAWDSSQERDE